MSESEYQKLLELRLQRALLPEEQSRLDELVSQHPEIRDHWDEEMRLSGLLNRLSDAPVSSNFTARTLAAVQKETAPKRAPGRRLFDALPMRWIHAVTATAAAMAAAWFLYDQKQSAGRAEMAGDVAQVSSAALAHDTLKTEVSLEALMHFEEISRLETPPIVDDDLLAALQQE
jgi:hypothetical protein